MTDMAAIRADPSAAVARLVDTHIHVWTAADPAYPMRVPPQRYPAWRGTTEEYLADMDSAGLDRAVIVQIPHHRFDHSYVLAARDAHPHRFAVVGLLDPYHPDAADTLHRLVRHESIQGIRITLRPGQRLDLDRLTPLCRRAADLAAPVLMQIAPEHLPAIDDLARRFPGLAILIDHVGMPSLQDGPPFGDLEPLFRAARHPNLHVKASHLYGLNRPGNQERHIPALLRALRDAFGADRLLAGSNWPLVRDKGGLARWAHDMRQAIATWPPNDQHAILAGTASRLYRWSDT